MVANGMEFSSVWQFYPAPSFIYSTVLCMRRVREFGQILKLLSEWMFPIIGKIDELGSCHSDGTRNDSTIASFQLAAECFFEPIRLTSHLSNSFT